jgi:release factor glutamine methyltransferase
VTRDALRAAAGLLADVSDTPRLDAELLLAHALGVSRGTLLLSGQDMAVPEEFRPLLERRLAGEPIAYILGTRDFWTITLEVAPGVLIPRPDSETLIEAAVDHFRGTAGPRTVLDLGTGSGALLLAALTEWPEATGVGIDRSEEAIRIARANVQRLGLGGRATIRDGGWTGWGGPYDLILCNPPYIASGETLPRDVAAFEPASALYAGEDGLDDYRLIAPAIGRQIAAGGVACIEIGSTQAAPVSALFKAEGLEVETRRDLAGRDRCLILRR